LRLILNDEARARLDEHFPTGRAFRFRESSRGRVQPTRREGEIVLVMGLPGAGKSTVAKTLAARGYARLNRDEAGGSLRALVPKLEALVASGSSRIVLDNTYVTRKSRAPVLQAAWQTGLPVRGLWLSTSVEDAQVNAVTRIVLEHGRLLMPDEMQRAAKDDVSAFGPAVQFRYQRELEMPDVAEGFTRVDVLPFIRRHNPASTNRAVIIWCDGVLARSRSGRRAPSSPDDLDVDAIRGRGEVLRQYEEDGWYVLGISWQPEIAAEQVTHEQVFDTFARLRERLGVEMDVEYCPHAGGPPVCWCRKPLPGLGVAFIQRYRLDPRQCIYVGDGPQDEAFARRLGFAFREAADFFAT
jgi:histidinol phosphatase-like enzyme